MLAKRIGMKVSTSSAIFMLPMMMVFVPGASVVANGQQVGGTTSTIDAPVLPGKGVAGPVTDVQHNFADQAFTKSVLERDAGDLQLCQLAAQKSQSDDVKQLGLNIIENRTSLDVQFKVIAKTLSVAEPKGPSKKDKQLIARLEGLSGPQFDEEFIKALAKIYRQDGKDFQVEAQTAQEPSVLQVAQQDANVLSKKLQEIQQIAQAHNIALDAKK